MREGVFLTGGTGFIGRHLLPRLVGRHRVRCLIRRPAGDLLAAGAEPVLGDLRKPITYAAALDQARLVVHLGAVTGKAPKADYFAVNVDGTRALVDTCRTAGVSGLLLVSSIAATYPDTTSYYYAQSKQLAEQAVRESGLDYLIVRPTLVLGRDSPILTKLAMLARLPVMPIFGDGSVRVQPIDVDDVATYLAAALDNPALGNCATDLGGPEVLSMEDFLRRMRRVLIGRDSPVVHLPARPLMSLLHGIERWSSLLPFSAGQLSAFVNDSVAAYDSSVSARVPRMKSIDEMLQSLTTNG